MALNFRTIDLTEDPVDFAAPASSTSSSTASYCTCTKTIVTRVLAHASRLLTVPAINTGCARPSDPVDILDVISKSDLRRFTLKELQVATCNFSDKFIVGEGGYGNVYKAVIPDGSFVAVKRLKFSSHQGLEEFQAEVEITSTIRHRNLATAIGLCVSKKPKETILVYPFKVNGDLHFRLRKSLSQPPLDWPTRKRILVGAARGLCYLHNNRIIHRDIKPSNILLDENLEACVADFGLAKVFNKKKQEFSSFEVQNLAARGFATEREIATNSSTNEYTEMLTNRVKGTYGYMAPEYTTHGICSVKIDVFSFGVTILEVVMSREGRDIMRRSTVSREDMTSSSWARSCLKDNRLDELIDHGLLGDCNEDEVKKIIQLGLACTLSFPGKRPSMLQVVQVLEGADLEDIGADTDYIMTAEQAYEGVLRSHSLTCTSMIDSVTELLPEELSGPR